MSNNTIPLGSECIMPECRKETEDRCPHCSENVCMWEPRTVRSDTWYGEQHSISVTGYFDLPIGGAALPCYDEHRLACDARVRLEVCP